jgi:hypothetical protein
VTSRTLPHRPHRRRPDLVLALCVVLVPALLAGCASRPAQAGEPGAHSGHTRPDVLAPGSSPWPTAPAPAPEAALQLQSLLGQHSVLAADMMRGRIRDDEDFGQAASTAVSTNSDALAQVVGSLFDEPAATRFHEMWANHVTAFFNYARGLATGDAGVSEEARTTLVRFENDLADFFSAASQGRLSRDAARTAVLTHVDHLLAQADAYAAKDYARSDELYRTGHAHAFQLGQALAATLLPPDQAAALESPAWRLRSELDRLLGEHVALVVAALRAGATDSPDFATAATAVNGNTADLAAAVGALFGDAAADEFLSLWADHVDLLMGYTTGVATSDAARKDQASAGLRDFETRMAAFLGTATGNRLASADLAKAFLAHDEMLLRQVDAFAAKDYPQAQALAYDTYRDMFDLARQLADAFGDTVSARLPQGGAATGGGGTAPGPR